jgi:hypothetical protein
MKFTTVALAATAATFASAATKYTRCAVEAPAPETISALNEVERIGVANQEFSRVAARNVPVYVHVVTTTAKKGRYSQTQINNQISTMNAAYSGLGVTFTLKSTDFTANNAWAAADIGSSAEKSMKAALKKGRYSELDLYFATDIPGGTLGWCYFPVQNPTSSDLALDGCVNLADSLPGGSATNYNEGATATTKSATGSACTTSSRAVAPALVTRSPIPRLRALRLLAALWVKTLAREVVLIPSTTGWITAMILAWTGSLLDRLPGLLRSSTS